MIPTAAFCTIISRNYLSHARVLCDSLAAEHPECERFVLVIDEWKEFIRPAEEPFTLVSLDDIGLTDEESMRFRYDVTEFSTALKPFLLEHILVNLGYPKVVYLDPDILVTSPLSNLLGKLDECEYIVTPHLNMDYPDDGRMPNDTHILISGIYNLGFFAIRHSEAALALLHWWQHKLRSKCVVDIKAGYFVDQRFIDLAVGLFDGVHIERDVGYNVAYWNLHSRNLARDEKGWSCNGRPLRFFHFSSYKLESPETIAPYTNRYTLADRADLAPIFQHYGGRLAERGYWNVKEWGYGFAKFSSGRRIPLGARVLYRWLEGRGIKVESPFSSKLLANASVAITAWEAIEQACRMMWRQARFAAYRWIGRFSERSGRSART